MVSSMDLDTINETYDTLDAFDRLSFTYQPAMPDLYLPFVELEKCPDLELKNVDAKDEEA